MKEEKFKVLLYLKKSSPDKSGKTPIMGRITIGLSMAQFSCKLSCTPNLWNPRESRLNGKGREAVDTNAKLDKLLLSINEAYNVLLERKQPFTAEAVKDLFQGSVETQMTLLKLFDRHNEEMKARIGIDRAAGTLPNHLYARKYLAEFINSRFNVSDLAFSQLNEQFIRDFQDFVLGDKGLAMDTLRHYLAILKKVCKMAYKKSFLKEERLRDKSFDKTDALQVMIKESKSSYIPMFTARNSGTTIKCLGRSISDSS